MNIGTKSRKKRKNDVSFGFHLRIHLFLIFILYSVFISISCSPAQYQLISTSKELYSMENQNIIIEGKISDIQWQHMIGFNKDYPNICYLDFEKSQTVVYSKTQIECKDKIRIRGKIVKISGKSKKPGSDEDYSENHILADDWECLK